jgi:hypothetical protein
MPNSDCANNFEGVKTAYNVFAKKQPWIHAVL